MEVHGEVVEASTRSGPMAVLHKWPAGDGMWPRVVMFHDGPGVRNATHQFAVKLAAAGYDVAVPDLYHRHGRLIGFEPHEREADPTLVDRLWEMLRSLTDDGIQADLDATLETLEIAPTERLGVIGFCVGARAVFRSLMRLPEQFVVGAMWHPSFLADEQPDSPHLTAGRLTRPLFIGMGDADRMQPIEKHQPFLDAVDPLAHVELQVFPGADHGFSWPDWPTYDDNAASGCFDRTTSLFQRHLGSAGTR
jgi:carboxymethylenebutenolidase